MDHVFLFAMDLSLGDLVHHNEMILLPVCNAGQGNLIHQLIKINFDADGLEPRGFSCIAYPEQAYPFTGKVASFPQCLKGIVLSIEFCDHPEARRSAIFGIVLLIKGETGHT